MSGTFFRTRKILAFVLFLAAGSKVHAQVITGSIFGTIKDESDSVLPGATVTISSPALPSGPASETTNSKGQYRFPTLAPGTYGLTVSLAGFGDYREEGIRVGVGVTVERNVNLKLAAMVETVTVTGESPVVDTRKSGVSTNYSNEYMNNTPIRRFSMFDIIKAAPGMSATTPSGNAAEVAAFGSNADENSYNIDGANLTSPFSGGTWALPATDVIEEVEIMSLGPSAEYGNVQGAVFNVVTRQGTNDFRVDTSYYSMSDSLTSKPLKLPCNCPDGQTGYTRDRFHDFNVNGGGPILRDRLWFFAGFQYQSDYVNQPGTNPQFPREFDTNRYFYKLTWQISSKLKLLHSFSDDRQTNPATPSVSRPYELLTTSTGTSRVLAFDVTHLLGKDTWAAYRVSGFVTPYRLTVPNNGSYTLPRRNDQVTGLASGGASTYAYHKQSRTEIHGKLSHYATDFLNADHDFKFGVQWSRGFGDESYGIPGDIIYYDRNGAPYRAYMREPYHHGGTFKNLGLFAEDVVRVGERVTLSLGVRFDNSRAYSSDVDVRDGQAQKTGETIPGLGELWTWNNVSPRLGFNLKLTGDGKTVLRGNWGRSYRGVLVNELIGFHPGNTPFSEALYNPATGRYEIISTTVPGANEGYNPDLKAPYSDQFTIGVDRQLTADVALGASFIRKDGKDFTGWEDVRGVYGTETRTLADGQTITVFPLLNRPRDRFYLLTNPEPYFADYNGLLLIVNKRWSKGWQALASYTLSKAEGLVTGNGRDAGVRQGFFAATTSFRQFGRDPNDFTNNVGILNTDRTHMFRIQGAVEVPWVGVLVGTNYQYLTGQGFAGYANVLLPQGSRRVALEPRASRRLSAQNLWDLRVSKIFRFHKTGRVEVLVDILNLLNTTAEETLITQNFFSPNFGRGNTFVEPRRAMLGVKFSY